MARNHLGIADTGRTEAPARHFPRQVFLIVTLALRHFKWQILWITILVCLAVGLSLFGLSQTLWHPAPSTNLLPPSQQGNVPPVLPTTPTSIPQKVLDPGMHGVIIFDMGGKNIVAYGIGSMFTPPGSDLFPRYEFPLYVSRTTDSPIKTLAVISDPRIETIGDKWESALIRDPDHENFLLKVELTRTAEAQKYNIRFLFSPDNGKGWMKVEFPP